MHTTPTPHLEDLSPGAGAHQTQPPHLRFHGLDPRISGCGGAKYKALSPARLPISRSPCITISPGSSPSALLESPVLLNNIKAEPSPTTGTFLIPSILNCSVGSDTLSSPKESSNSSAYDEGSSGDFEFKPCTKSSLGSVPPQGSLVSLGTKQQEQFVLGWSQCQSQTFAPSSSVQPESVGLTLSVSAPNQAVETDPSRASMPAEFGELQQEKASDNGWQALQIDPKGTDPSTAEKTSEDGYNWRKYGQKHVKGSEFPRSYYKCTHPNCQVKKQLERSHDGHIADIIYKGNHDHPKPQPSRRSAVGAVFSGQEEERIDGFSTLVSMEDDKSTKIDGQITYHDPSGPMDTAPGLASDDDIDGAGVKLNNIGDDVGDDDDPESKRRRKDAAVVDVNTMGNKLNREPRVVVQTLSEVDILDDGYRWRKYGQKVVKGNPNPRSYYKCTNVGCPVRKHVERASHDPKAVITTYEGKHNHDVPAARTSSHDTAVSMPTNDSGSRTSQMPATFNGIPRTFDNPRSTQHQYNQSEECDTISLDLGVGLSPRHKERADDRHQASRAEHIQNPQSHITSSYGQVVIQANPVPACYSTTSNGMVYVVPREETGDGFSFKAAPLNHSSNPYHASMGRLLMGP